MSRMADIPPEPTILGIKVAHLVAGGLGGLIRSLTNSGGSLSRHITSATVGAVMAGYGTPIGAYMAASYLAAPDIPPISVEGLVGYMLGLTGLSLTDMVLRWIRAWRDRPPPFPPLPPVERP